MFILLSLYHTITLYNAYYQTSGVKNESSHAGHSYLIKRVLSTTEASSLFEENPQLFPRGKDGQGNIYYETSVSGKTFLTQSLQNDIFIQPLQHDKSDENEVFFEGSSYYESPIFLLEDENGELFLTRLNELKCQGGLSEKPYTSYIIENHIAYLKKQYVGKIYKMNCYPDPDEIGRIEDVVIRDNVLNVKYVNIKTQSIGYRTMNWGPTNKWIVDNDIYCARVVNKTANYYKNGEVYALYQQFILRDTDIQITEREFNKLIGI